MDLTLFLACSVVVTFIIGFPCLLVGCNPNVPGGCATRAVDLFNLTHVSVTENECCSRCQQCSGSGSHKSCHSYCCRYGCSDYVLHFSAVDSTRHCSMEFGIYESSSAAMNAGLAWTIGHVRRLVYDPNTKICDTTSSSLRVWIVGVTFLSLCALSLLLLVGPPLLQCASERVRVQFGRMRAWWLRARIPAPLEQIKMAPL